MKWKRGWLMGLLVMGALAACEQKPTDDDEDGDASGGESSSGGQGSGGAASGGAASGGAAAALGERGSSCDSSSDCDDGLSCIVTAGCPVGVACANKTCQPSNFDIMGTGKQCHIVQCAKREDCCGDMPLEAPAKCDVRDITCNQPSLPGCTAITCTMDEQCGAGDCAGYCVYATTESCETAADCRENVCDFGTGSGGSGSGGNGSGGNGSGGDGSGGATGTCTVTGGTCYSDANCPTNSCSTPYCHCENPEYDPTDPICSDEDCEGICGWTCEDEQCVVDTSCNIDSDCLGATPLCGDDGTCVECLADEDCEDEDCIDGRCGPECKVDTQCGLFESCTNDKCVYVGCQTDRECVLSAQAQGSDQDPRLAVCDVEGGIGTCVFPCEIDAQCATTEVCLDGVCEYIGCETNAECKTIAGLHNRPPPTDEQPWTTTAECRAESTE